jgi:hypothetical protein
MNVVLSEHVNYAYKIVNWVPRFLMKLALGQV